MSERKQDKILSYEEIKKQDVYIDEIKKLNDEHYRKTGIRKKHIIVTWGCQMNEHDSEKMSYMFHKMGFENANEVNEADVILFNTCAVRENAEQKVFGNIGRIKTLKETNPNVILGICGCMTQQDHIVEKIKKSHRHVDIVFGTHNFYKLPEMMLHALHSNSTYIDVWDIDGKVIEGLESERKFDLKAFVNIMYGCNNFCSYCIVPYTRGRERSREPKEILKEVERLVSYGTKEITLLGQNVNSYGKDIDYTFAELLRDVSKVEGLKRLRFMTSHPKDLSEDVIIAIKENNNICNHIHLPVQSGSSYILKKMNRVYTKEKYLNLIEMIKTHIPNASFTTDIIVGFPGETEEDFKETLDLVEKVRYDSAFTFLYSIRKGTPAEKMKDQVPENIKHERFEKLLNLVNKIGAEKNSSYKDKIVEILVEGKSKNNENIYSGRTTKNKLVNFEGGDDSLIGELVKVKIINPKTHSLDGVLVK